MNWDSVLLCCWVDVSDRQTHRHGHTQGHTHQAYREEFKHDSASLKILWVLAAGHGGPCVSCVLKMAGSGLWSTRRGTWSLLDRNLAWSSFPWSVRGMPWRSAQPTRRTCSCPSRRPPRMPWLSAGKEEAVHSPGSSIYSCRAMKVPATEGILRKMTDNPRWRMHPMWGQVLKSMMIYMKEDSNSETGVDMALTDVKVPCRTAWGQKHIDTSAGHKTHHWRTNVGWEWLGREFWERED